MPARVLVVCLVLMLFWEESSARGCPTDRLRQGCRLQDGYCLCGFGCDSDYRYHNRNECITALRGEGRDACSRNPCRNGGHCTQKTEKPWFTCHCAGTGYHGVKCETRCPTETNNNVDTIHEFPFDCIVI
jgi:hypothetical protein